MSWTEEKVNKLKELWGKGNTASQIAEIIGGISRNAVIGKAHRLKLSAKIIKRSRANSSTNSNFEEKNNIQKRSRKVKFRSLLLDKNFEPAKNLSLEELTENTCKYMEGHPNESSASFCGRKNVEKLGLSLEKTDLNKSNCKESSRTARFHVKSVPGLFSEIS